MFKSNSVIAAIEIGTSKFSVLFGECFDDGTISIIGRGQASAEHAVIKGEVVDMDLALTNLSDAVEDAEESAGVSLNNCSIVVMSISGCDMASYLGNGSAVVKNFEGIIGEAEVNEAVHSAQLKTLPPDRERLGSFDAYYRIDDARIVDNPFGQKADKLEAFSHVIHGDANRIENFRMLIRDIGLEDEVKLVFTPIADAYGILTEDEKNHGVLLVDLGAGVTDYTVICRNGVLASGMIPVGFEHVANDLSIGLDLPISSCRKMIAEESIERAIIDNLPFLNCTLNGGGKRDIPLESFKKIIDCRLREIFEVVKRKMANESFWRNINAGGVLTGGGAKYFRSRELFSDVFNLTVHMGQPFDANGALTDLADPRYSTVWGTLKFGHALVKLANAKQNSLLDNVTNAIAGVGDLLNRRFQNFRRGGKRNPF